MRLHNVQPDENQYSDWRESWHPENVQVWGRVTDGADDCVAIKWLHEAYQKADRRARLPELNIKQTSVTGCISEVGRLWHRMYPVVSLVKDAKDANKKIPKLTPNYLELLTIFPDDSKECKDFLHFLNSHPEGFQQLWPLPQNPNAG
jgi:CRISPR-associated protein Cmr6